MVVTFFFPSTTCPRRRGLRRTSSAKSLTQSISRRKRIKKTQFSTACHSKRLLLESKQPVTFRTPSSPCLENPETSPDKSKQGCARRATDEASAVSPQWGISEVGHDPAIINWVTETNGIHGLRSWSHLQHPSRTHFAQTLTPCFQNAS